MTRGLKRLRRLALMLGLLPTAAAQAVPSVVPAGPLVVYQQATQNFTGTGCNILNSLGWSWSASGAGTITPVGAQNVNPASATFTAGSSPGSATVLAYCNALLAQTIAITVPAVAVTVDPVGTLPQGGTATLNASVTHNNPAVTWSAPGAAGTITGNVFTAGTTAGTYTITARSVADPTKTGTTTVTVLPPVAVSINPTSATLPVNGQQQFTASVANHPNQAVSWSSTVGGIDAAGRYTASFPGGGYVTIKATSVADPTKSASAQVAVVGVTLQPASAVVTPGSSRQFVAQVVGSQQSVTWTTNAPGATVSSTGLVTTSTSTAPGTYTVSAQTVGSPSASGSATLIVSTQVGVVGVRVSPPTAIVRGGNTLQLAAAVLGPNNEPHPDRRVSWSSNAPAPGVHATSGLFTAPDVAGTYTVTATSVADPTRTGSASLSVRREVSVAPTWTTLAPLASQTFSARAYGVSNPAIVWSLQEGASAGTVTTGGVYTAPATPGTYHLVATATANAQVQAVATIVVTPAAPVSLSLTPDTVTLAPAATQVFTAHVHGTPNTAVGWSTSAGTIDASGLFTAPSSHGAVTVTAVSLADPNVRAQATVTITDGIIDRTLTYDANGNLTGDGEFTYAWDAENRLVRAIQVGVRSGPDVRYHYDGLGRRFLIEDRRSQQVTRRRYVWIGNQIAEERNSPAGAYPLPTSFPATPTTDAEMSADYAEHAAELQRQVAAAEQARAAATALKEATRQASPLLDPATLVEVETVETRFFAAGLQVAGVAVFDLEDHLGSTRLALDGTGSVVGRHVYDPFGNLSTTLGDAPKRGFTAHLYQPATGLHLTRTRAYSADLGRWLSRDPIQEAAGLNLYAYVGGDPLNSIDPLGLWGFPWIDPTPFAGPEPWWRNPAVKRCVCDLWDQANQGRRPQESGQRFYKNSRSGYHCTMAPYDSTHNKRKVGHDPNAVANAHTHPTRHREPGPGVGDYAGCKDQPGLVISSKRITLIPQGCADETCTVRLAGPTWYGEWGCNQRE